MPKITPPPAYADPRIHSLFSRWSQFASAGRLPTIADMNLDELFAEMPEIFFVEVQNRPNASRRYFISRASNPLNSIIGRQVEGYSIDELVPQQQIDEFVGVYDEVVDNKQPHYWNRMHMLFENELVSYARLLLPVADDGETVAGLIGLLIRSRD